MGLRLFDTRAHELTDFVPLVAGQVSIYVCGPTVQSSPHVGHLRSALTYDVLVRWLEVLGNRVTLVRNITDIDDKVLVNAAAAGEDWRALAQRSEREFHAVYTRMGVRPPTYEPRATGHVTQMITLISRLIEAGHAYAADDGTGDVFFATESWPDYGSLTRQLGDDMESDEAADDRGKRNPRDFALWKGHKTGDPASASWPAPWGPGRPGWHIECSAMAVDYLGPVFDIHGGGLDLRFPHHENELAQSSAVGDAFARYWLHNGLVAIAGQKMSKSLGNSVFAADLLSEARPIVVRYLLGSAHYRSTLELHTEALTEAAAAFERIESFLDRTDRLAEKPLTAGELPNAFVAGMNDDLGVPSALAVIHETVRAGNTAWDSDDAQQAVALGQQVVAMLDVLGLNPRSAAWATSSSSSAQKALGALVDRLLVEREAARAAKDFSTSDRVRDDLGAAGIVIEDTSHGAVWSING
ncbi:MAG: cysteine--tRNA ligase [Actinobacteria bacterium]|uniref:Cysteine--tRNA ligase n=1 Tax=freshwater metagenome TaxID=449393 RepID=A0A6J7G7Z4_9ZZZZ|nr:cysteine--tRNA ligase [Actinomycetota bacterium]